MKRFFESDVWKWIRTAGQVALLFAAILGVLFLLQSMGLAEQEMEERFVLCMDRVNVRMGPGRDTCEIGWLECGDRVWVDGKKKNGYVHVVGLNIEAGEGWIHKGYLVEDAPVWIGASGRVTGGGRVKARTYVDGKKRMWMKAGAKVKIYWWSADWCLTECGYVRSRFLEMEVE